MTYLILSSLDRKPAERIFIHSIKLIMGRGVQSLGGGMTIVGIVVFILIIASAPQVFIILGIILGSMILIGLSLDWYTSRRRKNK